MKKFNIGWLTLSLLVGVMLVSGDQLVWAHHHDKTPDQTLTGEVVCLSCYMAHNGMGEDHASCAMKCFTEGLPVGLKVGDKLYVAVGEDHESANKMLSKYAGKQVTVMGQVYKKEGMNMIEVEKVAKAK